MKDLESIIEHYWSTTIAFLPSSHTRSPKSRLSRSLLRTQGTSRYYAKFLLQISFPSLPIELDIKYILFISNPHIRFPRSRLPGSLLQTQGTSRYYATFLLQISFLPLPIKLDIIYIYIQSSYQIPPDQGFQGHYFKLRELQSNMQHFSYKFRSFRFQSN